MHEKSGRKERGNRGSESGSGKQASRCETLAAGEQKGRNRNLSSQSLKRKGSKENGSEGGQRPKEEADERKQKVRPAPGSQLREMNREGRKRTRQRTE